MRGHPGQACKTCEKSQQDEREPQCPRENRGDGKFTEDSGGRRGSNDDGGNCRRAGARRVRARGNPESGGAAESGGMPGRKEQREERKRQRSKHGGCPEVMALGC